MKILLVSGEYPPMKGGVGRYTYNLAREMAKRSDVDVSVAISAPSGRESDSNNGSSRVAIYGNITKKGDKRNSYRLLKVVSEIKPDIVNIQYERGLYEVDTTIRHTIWRLAHGSTLNQFYKECPIPTVSTLHTVFPQDEYQAYVKERSLRKEGRFGFLPMPLRAAIRRTVMTKRYDLLLEVVRLSDEIISPAKTIQDVIKRGTVIYHGAQPAVQGHGPTTEDDRYRYRSELGLPLDRKLLLAFGYAGSYKGFDVLTQLHLPDGWSLVVKQTKHERGFEKPIDISKSGDNSIISLQLGYLDDIMLSKLFLACDAIIFPYRIVSISGVMFDALAHGLPFIASDLRFFKEFADIGLGIACKRDSISFDQAMHTLANSYDNYKRKVEQFSPNLQWSNVAQKHIELFSRLISSPGIKPANKM
jgi:glycosyltransferase involved in cell wall biosynthesis